MAQDFLKYFKIFFNFFRNRGGGWEKIQNSKFKIAFKGFKDIKGIKGIKGTEAFVGFCWLLGVMGAI